MERRELLKKATGIGLATGLLASPFSGAYAVSNDNQNNTPATLPDGTTPEDWHTELTNRIMVLEEKGGGTLELGDGVYEINKTLHLPRPVSLVMSPNAVIRARSNFEGEAIIVKGAGTNKKYSQGAATAGWIQGGVIDGNKQYLIGIQVEDLHRLEIADLSVRNALHKGVYLKKGGNESNLTRVRCDVDMDTWIGKESIGIHVEKTDCKFLMLHVLGYETGIRSDAGSNWFTQIHVWNWVPTQGDMKHCFYCNGTNNAYSQCYADSPLEVGFYVTAPHQSFMQCRVFYSQWAADNAGVGFYITPNGKYGNYVGNALFSRNKENDQHRLGKAFDGDLEGSTIIGNTGWNGMGGYENRIPSGESPEQPSLNLSGNGIRLKQQTEAPTADQGETGEVRWVDDGTSNALWVKTTKGWKKSELK